MARKKAVERCSLLPWCSGQVDCKEKGGFIQVGASLFRNKKFNSLKSTPQLIYLRLLNESRGKREFEISNSSFSRFNGIDEKTYKRALKVLIDAGFVERVFDENESRNKTTTFRFCLDWKCNTKP